MVQAADPLDSSRINNVFEHWDNDDHLLVFRCTGQPARLIRHPFDRADVRQYVISAVHDP